MSYRGHYLLVDQDLISIPKAIMSLTLESKQYTQGWLNNMFTKLWNQAYLWRIQIQSTNLLVELRWYASLVFYFMLSFELKSLLFMDHDETFYFCNALLTMSELVLNLKVIVYCGQRSKPSWYFDTLACCVSLLYLRHILG